MVINTWVFAHTPKLGNSLDGASYIGKWTIESISYWYVIYNTTAYGCKQAIKGSLVMSLDLECES